MKKCTLLLNEILGQEKWCKLFLDTLTNIKERKKELKIRDLLEAIHFNHQALLFIATQKAEGIEEKSIEKSLQWKEDKVSRFILDDDVSEFCRIYKDYIDDIISFIKRN